MFPRSTKRMPMRPETGAVSCVYVSINSALLIDASATWMEALALSIAASACLFAASATWMAALALLIVASSIWTAAFT